MRELAKLLLGDEAARALDLLAGKDGPRVDETAADGRVRRSGAWCGTTPGTPGQIMPRGSRAR
jgi:hypothetical protein